MPKGPETLLPVDVAVALYLARDHGATYAALADGLGVSNSVAYRAVQRLEKAGLLVPEERRVMAEPFWNFLVYGTPHAFFAEPGPEAIGVPTAHSAPPLSAEFGSDRPVVWSSAEGSIRGAAVEPLLKQAPQYPGRRPNLYRALALVDALRIGQARERKRAAQLLREYLGLGPADDTEL